MRTRTKRLELLLIAAAALTAILFIGGSTSYAAAGKDPIKLMGHRGYSSAYPENTMAAFEGAYQAGFFGNEIDVWESDNGDLMVFHDNNTGRMCQGKSDWIWHVNSKNRTRSRYRIPYDGRTVVIPTLQEVLRNAKTHGNTMILLHIKKYPGKYDLSKKGVNKIVRLIKHYGMQKQVVIFATKTSDVGPFVGKGVRIGRICSSYRRAEVNQVISWLKKNKGDTLVITRMDAITRKNYGRNLVNYCHKRGIQIGTYSTRTAEDLRYLISIKADFAMSNWDLLSAWRGGFAATSPILKGAANEAGGILLKWEFPCGTTRCTYQVLRSEDGLYFQPVGTAKARAKNTGVFLDKTAVSGRTYSYMVQARYRGAESAISQPASILRLKKSKITSLKRSGGVLISWKAVPGARGYTVWKKHGRKWKQIGKARGENTLTLTDRHVRHGKRYSYRVRAYGSGTHGAFAGASIRY